MRALQLISRVFPARRARPRAFARAPLWTPAFVRLLMAGCTYGFAFSSFHLMPKFLAVEFGATPTQIGWSAGVFGIASVVASAAIGACIDRVSRRRMFAVSALLLAATSAAFTAVDSMGPAVFVLRALQGVAFTMQMASMSTLVAELAPPSRLAEAVGYAGSSMLIMNAVAPAVDEPLARAYGWASTFVVAGVAAIVAAALVLDGPSRRATVAAPVDGTLRDVLSRGGTRLYGSVTLLTAIAFATMFTFLQPLALDAGYRDVGPFFVAYALAACAVRVFGGWAPDRYGRRRVALAALAPYALVVAFTGWKGPVSLLGIGTVFGLAHGALFPSLNALAIESSRPQERGRLLTVIAGAFNLGAWGGAAALGPVAEAAGYGAVFAIGAASATGALALLALSPRRGAAAASALAPAT